MHIVIVPAHRAQFDAVTKMPRQHAHTSGMRVQLSAEYRHSARRQGGRRAGTGTVAGQRKRPLTGWYHHFVCVFQTELHDADVVAAQLVDEPQTQPGTVHQAGAIGRIVVVHLEAKVGAEVAAAERYARLFGVGEALCGFLA